MSAGGTDLREEYVEARRALLDALEALAPQRDAVILSGAQAIYVRTGGGGLPIADFTTDGDLALDPTLLADAPALATLMENAGFDLAVLQGAPEPGIWERPVTIRGTKGKVQVDLIVPSDVAPPGGTRGARLPSHGKRAARKATGLEAALIDNETMSIEALDPADKRTARVRVAGFAALLVAKAHKLKDRLESGREDRLDDKDASDVVQLMRAAAPGTVAQTLTSLEEHPTAGPSVRAGLDHFQELFGSPTAPGIEMAVRAMRIAIPEERVRAICLAYATALRNALEEAGALGSARASDG